METLGAFPDGEWECFGRMFAIEENDDSPQLLSQSSLLLGEDYGNFGIQSMFCSTPEAGGIKSMFYSLDSHNPNLQYISQESSHNINCSGSTVLLANPGHTNYFFDYPDHVPANNSDRSENSDHSQVEPIVDQLITKQLKLNKRMLDVPELDVHVEDKINSCGNPKKKPRASKDVQRCMKNAESKKSQKVDRNGNEAEETNAGSDGHSSSSYTSEQHNMSEENSGVATSASKLPVALSLNGKTRASRGSATDPQSLYARKRRERINERLRILQNLVPNGTKVDISTMLEEAIHYVKFMQFQIKLLSSDDLWMYAPIAYNGFDVGLNLSQKISPPL